MNHSFVRVFTTTALAAGLLFGAADFASAKGGPKGGGAGVHGPYAMAPGFSQGRKVGWHNAGRPPGWSHGRKTGWRGGSVPPGWR